MHIICSLPNVDWLAQNQSNIDAVRFKIANILQNIGKHLKIHFSSQCWHALNTSVIQDIQASSTPTPMCKLTLSHLHPTLFPSSKTLSYSKYDQHPRISPAYSHVMLPAWPMGLALQPLWRVLPCRGSERVLRPHQKHNQLPRWNTWEPHVQVSPLRLRGVRLSAHECVCMCVYVRVLHRNANLSWTALSGPQCGSMHVWDMLWDTRLSTGSTTRAASTMHSGSSSKYNQHMFIFTY